MSERMTPEELADQCQRSIKMIATMCKEKRCPKMSIPARIDDDEDFVIINTLKAQQTEIDALRAELAERDSMVTVQ